jgi:hypothetical protein
MKTVTPKLRFMNVTRNPPLLSLSSQPFCASLLVGLKALNEHAPRDKAAMGIKMIDMVKVKLKQHFEAIAAEGRVITPEDIHEFFATHCGKRP